MPVGKIYFVQSLLAMQIINMDLYIIPFPVAAQSIRYRIIFFFFASSFYFLYNVN